MTTNPSAQPIDGVALSQQLRAEVARAAAALTKRGVRPGLAVILVGEDPASQVSMLLKNQESFRLQEDKGTKPNVHYIGKYSVRA